MVSEFLSGLSVVFAQFLDRGGNSTLFLYAMIVVLLGITINGIAYLLEPKASKVVEGEQADQPGQTTAQEHKPGVIVWEKAE